jgi:transposase
MKLHGNAALSWSGRRRLAERVIVEGWTLKAAAEAAGVSVRCARKWVSRYRAEACGNRRTQTLTTDFYGSAAATLLLRSTSV